MSFDFKERDISFSEFPIGNRAGPRRSEDGGALTAEGMYRAA